MSAFDWFRINNKYGFRLAKKPAQRKFFKFFITKDNSVRIDESAAMPILFLSKSLLYLSFPKHGNNAFEQTCLVIYANTYLIRKYNSIEHVMNYA